MLTYDDKFRKPPDVLKELVKKTTPDQIECGENNEYWVFVRRSTEMIELVDKVTGAIAHKCALKYVAKYGMIPASPVPIRLTPAQISAAKAGCKL